MYSIINERDHSYNLPGYMLGVGDRIVGWHKEGKEDWETVDILIKKVNLWHNDAGRWISVTTSNNLEMTFRTSELFMVVLSNEGK